MLWTMDSNSEVLRCKTDFSKRVFMPAVFRCMEVGRVTAWMKFNENFPPHARALNLTSHCITAFIFQ